MSWASTIAANFFQAYQEPVEDSPRLFFARTKDFKTYTTPQLLFDPGYTVRYGMIVRDCTRYALLHEDSRYEVRQLRVAFSDNPTGPWGPSSDTIGEGFHKLVTIALAGDSTVAEAGVPTYEAVNWWGIVAPAGTPQPIIDRLHAALTASQDTAEVEKQFAAEGAVVVKKSPAEFGAFMESEMKKWEQVVKKGNIKAE